MALIYEWGFHVKAGKEADFESWLALNEQGLAEKSPNHYEYLGTYVPVWDSLKTGYRQLWRYGSERVPDMRKAASDTSGEFTALAREYLSFVDETRSDDETFRLHRSVIAD